jgi:hypothetical protein
MNVSRTLVEVPTNLITEKLRQPKQLNVKRTVHEEDVQNASRPKNIEPNKLIHDVLSLQ